MVRKYILIIASGLLCGNIIQSVPATVIESRNIVRQLLTLLNRLEKVLEDHKDILREIRSEPPKKQMELYEKAIVQLRDLQQAIEGIQKEIKSLKSDNNTKMRNYLNFVQQQREAINEHIRAAKQEAQKEEELEAKSRGLIVRFTYFIKQKIAQWKGVESSLQESDLASYALISSYMRQLKRWDFILGALVGNATSFGSADPLSVAYNDLDVRITALQVLIQEAERMDAEVQRLKEKPVLAVSVIPPRPKVTSQKQQKPVAPTTKKPVRKKRTKAPQRSVHDEWKKIVEIPLNKPGVFITTARLSPDGKKLAILSEDGKCELYWVPTGKWLYRLGSEDETFAAVDFVDDNTLIASERTRVDYEVRERICLFSYTSNRCEKIIITSGMIPQVKQALYNRHNQQLLILTYDKKFYSVDATQSNRETEVASGISYMATDCTSGYSVTLSYDVEKDEYKVAVWDTQNQLVKEMISDEVITALAINMHIKKIATATNSNAIQLWDFETGKVSKTLKSYVWQKDDAGKDINVAVGHTGTIESLDFNADVTLLLSASHDQTARVWDLKTGTSQVIQQATGSLMRYVQFNCTRDRALIVNQHTVSVWKREASPEK